MDQEVQEKSWSDLSEDILNLIYPLVFDQSLSLMTLMEDEKVKFYHPVFENAYYDESPSGRFASSNFGWLLLNYGGGFLAFINPFTDDDELIVVPSILYDDECQIYHFSSPPTSSDCTIIAMKNDNISGGTDIAIIKRGEKEWDLTQFDDFGSFKTSYCNAVFFDGRYYFMGDEFNIGIFDVNANDWKVCNQPLVPRRKSYLYCPLGMVEDNGQILVVYESREHQQLYLARFDPSTMIWEKVDCLGDDKVLYVSECASYLETITAKGMGNTIYFPKFHGGSSVFYSLLSKKYHSSDGSYCSKGPYRLVEPRFSAWIKPNYSNPDVEWDSESKSSNGKRKHFSDPVKRTTSIQEG